MSSEAPQPRFAVKGKTMANHERDRTWDQAIALLEVAREKDISQEQITAIQAGGYWADLLDADIAAMNRDEFRAVCHLAPLTKPVPKPAAIVAVESVDPFRVTDEIAAGIHIPALAAMTEAEVRAIVPGIRKEQGIERNDAPTNSVTMRLATVVRSNEEWIAGSESERRFTAHIDEGMGLPQALWLVEHQDEPDLAAFKAMLGKVYILFSRIIVVNENGDRYVADLYSLGGRWCLRWYCLADSVNRYGRIAVASSK